MDQETLMDRLRNPQKYRKQQAQAVEKTEQKAAAQKPTSSKSRLPFVMAGIIVGLIGISLLFLFSAKNKAENVSSFLDPTILKGLMVDKTFNANTGRKYVQISEGADRNVVADELGSTLPVISRFNFRALTENNYKIIGAAPYALSINVSSNMEDAEIVRYLFNQDKMIKAFMERKDVKPLLEDPAALAKVLEQENKVKAFFADKVMQDVLSSEKVLEAIAGSRFMAYLLISKTGKYYRDHPQEAVGLIAKSPTLSALKNNQNVQKAVKENVYLEKIAPTLLK